MKKPMIVLVAMAGFLTVILTAMAVSVGGLTGCGVAATRGATGDGGGDGGVSDTTEVSITGTSVNTVSASVQSALSSAVSSMASSQSGLRLKQTEADNCTETFSDTSFQITCPCEEGGEIMHEINGTFSESSCTTDTDGEGFALTVEGSVTVTFSACQGTSTCGSDTHVVVMGGTMTGTMLSEYNECTGVNTFEVSMASEGGEDESSDSDAESDMDCDGLTVTVDPGAEDEAEVSMGMAMGLSGSGDSPDGSCSDPSALVIKNTTDVSESDDVVTASICVSGTEYDSFEAMQAALDPDGMCSESSALVTKHVGDACSEGGDGSGFEESNCANFDQNGISCETNSDCSPWDPGMVCDNTSQTSTFTCYLPCTADSDCANLETALDACGASSEQVINFNVWCDLQGPGICSWDAS